MTYDYAIRILDQNCARLEQFVTPLKKCKCNKDIETQVKINNKIKELKTAINILKHGN